MKTIKLLNYQIGKNYNMRKKEKSYYKNKTIDI